MLSPVMPTVKRTGNTLTTTSIVSIRPGKIDRSPTGTAVSARMALLHASGEMQLGDTLIARSILGSEFHGKIAGVTKLFGTG